MKSVSNTKPSPQDKKFLIGGIVRNCGNTLKDDVLFLQNAVIEYPDKHWFLVESDSEDNTVEVLRELETIVDNFRYISYGSLRKRIPARINRIVFCRNKYLEEFENDPEYKDADYVIMADFDGMNNCVTAKSIQSCWEKDDWTVVTANQWGPYYDIFALRHPIWSPNNCWESQQFLAQLGLSEGDSKFVSVYSRMIQIPEAGEWIEVDSAFGGLAMYRADAIRGLRYQMIDDTLAYEVCEHVPFHQLIKNQGGRIFINPRMINAELTDHSIDFANWKKSQGKS